MEPTFHNKEMALAKKSHEVKKQQIVTFNYEDRLLIKRVIATQGDHLQIKGNAVYVNGKKLKETYLKERDFGDEEENRDVVVPRNKIFVLGDNRNNSMDSREIGFVSVKKVKGHIVFHIPKYKEKAQT